MKKLTLVALTIIVLLGVGIVGSSLLNNGNKPETPNNPEPNEPTGTESEEPTSSETSTQEEPVQAEETIEPVNLPEREQATKRHHKDHTRAGPKPTEILLKRVL